MPRRNRIITKAGYEPFRIVLIGGPKKVFNKRRVRNRLATKPVYGYEPINSEWYSSLVTEIIAARHRYQLSQQALANILGTRQSEISLLETGKANPTAENIDRICRVLNISNEVKSS